MTAAQSSAAFLDVIMGTLGYAPRYLEPGKFQRFGPRKSGWAKLFEDCLGGVFGDYRKDLSTHWSAREAKSPAEVAAIRQQAKQASRQRETEQRAQWVKSEKSNAAMWAASVQVQAGDPVSTYLAARGLGGWKIPSCIRLHPGLAYWHQDDEGELFRLGHFPAMLAPIVRDGKLLAIHRTYLGEACKADVPCPKKLTSAAGPLDGSCIPLAQPHGGVIGIAEGIETAVAASLGSGLPTVAAYCAHAMSGLYLPRDIERLVIFADNDHAGQQAAAILAQRADKAGLNCKILTPSKPGHDWADVWLEGKQ